MTTDQIVEEPCEVKISSTVLKTSRRGDLPAEFISLHPTKRRITFTDKKGIGEVKLLGKWDIQSILVKRIKRVRLVKKADGYLCQFAIDTEAASFRMNNSSEKCLVNAEDRVANGEIGLDVGLEFFYSDSNGEHEPNPRFLRKAEKAIKHSLLANL